MVDDTLAKLGEQNMADMSYYNTARLYDIPLPESRAIAAE